ncbi:hypothetical protein IC619_004095 [Hazenella sp. IB182353]|uniref:hypothetical protein n=1 Tax=Polycladospora coralii TaxID=2771432 RepID=UPI0017475C07|nr:hypothetical protein [Polycladospora coralii]MBS7529675.1 hypothetical protein [Polycladospora coralii]
MDIDKQNGHASKLIQHQGITRFIREGNIVYIDTYNVDTLKMNDALIRWVNPL